ncbi:MAG TPA: hypothetical protein VHX15_16875 [Frankiaceae bacterium]|jgi:hypothetical protein|nr:hypothetical protein [Frankiaceae bacterium]
MAGWRFTAKRTVAHLSAVGVVAGSMVLAGGAPAGAAGQSVHGCPSGYVCLYKYDSYHGSRGLNRPDAELFTYGLHKIYGFTAYAGSTVDNQYGYYSPHNGQYFGAACYYRHANGTGFYTSDRGFPAQSVPHFDLYPINSVRLIKVTGSNGINC